MLFGQKIKNLFLIAITIATITSCKDAPSITYRSIISPIIGLNVPSGKEIEIKVQFGSDRKVDSVVYLLDTVKLETRQDTSIIKLKTEGLKLGNHLITAKVFGEGKSDDLTTNINVLSNIIPVEYSYKIIKSLPHDTSSYVEGLEYHDGYFYESAGDYGHSSIRKVEPASGKFVQKAELHKTYFGEGITVIGDKIIQLTYREKVGFVYDKASLKKIGEFSYTHGTQEGWGLYFDGNKVLNTDGSGTIFFLDKNTYQPIGSIEIFDNKGAVKDLNELEIIDGKIYANVYTTNDILIINPTSGAVEGRIDLSGLLPSGYFKTEDAIGNNVLNGIAYDAATKRMFVTGKKWPHIFEIKLIKK